MSEDDVRIRGYEVRIEESDTQLARDEDELNEIQGRLDATAAMSSRLNTLSDRLGDAMASADELRTRVTDGEYARDLELSTSELTRKKDALRAELDKVSSERSEAANAVKAAEKDLDRMREKHASVLVARGELIAAAREHEARLSERRDAAGAARLEMASAAHAVGGDPAIIAEDVAARLSAATGSLGGGGDDREGDDSDGKEVLTSLEACVAALEKASDGARATWRAADEAMGRDVGELSRKSTTLTAELNEATSAAEALRTDIVNARAAAAEKEARSTELSLAREAHYLSMASETALRREMEAVGYDFEMSRLSAEIQATQARVGAAEARVGGETSTSLNKRLKTKVAEATSLLVAAAKKAAISTPTSSSLTADALHLLLETLERERDAQASTTESQLVAAEADVRRLEAEEMRLVAEVRALRGQSEQSAAEGAADMITTETVLGTAKSALAAARERLSDARMRAAYVSRARDAHTCATCERPFGDPAEVDAFCSRHGFVTAGDEGAHAPTSGLLSKLEAGVIEAEATADAAARSFYMQEASMRNAQRVEALETRGRGAAAAVAEARETSSAKRVARDAARAALAAMRDARVDVAAAREAEIEAGEVRALLCARGETVDDEALTIDIKRIGNDGNESNDNDDEEKKEDHEDDFDGDSLTSLLARIGELTKRREEMFATKTRMEEQARRTVAVTTAAQEAMRDAEARVEAAAEGEARATALEARLESIDAVRRAKEAERSEADAELRRVEDKRACECSREDERRDAAGDAMRRVCLAVDRFKQVCLHLPPFCLSPQCCSRCSQGVRT